MAATETEAGSASRWGPLWGARPRDWAANEDQQRPTYEAALQHTPIAAGSRVLDIGCGTGAFLRLAADRGAVVSGLDASEALLAAARERLPEADLRVGDMESLPYGDGSFDLVAGFNSFFFADDMVAALREAGRVAKPGAPVVIQVWGRSEHCSIERMKEAVAPFMPGAPPGARRPAYFWKPGVLEELAAEASLTTTATFDTTWSYEYADEHDLLQGMLAAGGLALVAAEVGGNVVETAILESLAEYRTPAGGYVLPNEYHVVIAAAP
jgi:SAM-dependent methyltransferase